MIESIHARLKSVGDLSQEKISKAVDYVRNQREKINETIDSSEKLAKVKSELESRLAETRSTLTTYFKDIRSRLGS